MLNNSIWRHRTICVGLLFSFICLCGSAQPPVVPTTTPSAILAQLQDDELEKALELLGKAVDSGVPSDALSAASAGVYRALAQTSSNERFEMLYNWTIPSPERKIIRRLTTLVPEIAPPQEFARALGERPQEESFQIASVGTMPGLFDSGWVMIVAADESGSLSKLVAKLEELVDSSSPEAEALLTLAKIRSNRLDDELKSVIEKRISVSDELAGDSRHDAVLVAAAMERDEFGDACEQIASRIHRFEVESNLPDNAQPFTSFLRRLKAHVILKNRSPQTASRDLFYTVPKLWIAADDQQSVSGSTGGDEAIWLTHEDHVKRLAGPGEDVLLFKYPLSGSFELKAEVAQLEHGGGGLTFGGLGFDATTKWFRVSETQRQFHVDRTWPFVAPVEFRMFNRVNLRSDGKKVTFLSNLHPGWTGTTKACASAPWLGLRADGRGRVIFRNLELVGEPTIPSEVSLVGGDLRGWSSRYGETSPRVLTPFAFSKQPKLPAVVNPVWQVSDGVIDGANEEPSGDVLQSHLGYMRPLQQSETVSYEFFYEDGKTQVHPTLGRVAFLIGSRGVKLHWMTNAENEWTGIEADNSISEPLNRRGPRNLPLKSGEWNTASVTMLDATVSVTLNGEQIYERPLDDLLGRHFGFYHDRRVSNARIRNVKLTGDWPGTLSADQIGDLIAFD